MFLHFLNFSNYSYKIVHIIDIPIQQIMTTFNISALTLICFAMKHSTMNKVFPLHIHNCSILVADWIHNHQSGYFHEFHFVSHATVSSIAPLTNITQPQFIMDFRTAHASQSSDLSNWQLINISIQHFKTHTHLYTHSYAVHNKEKGHR